MYEPEEEREGYVPAESGEGPREADRVEELVVEEVEEWWGSGEDPEAVGESSGEGEEERRGSPLGSESFVAMVFRGGEGRVVMRVAGYVWWCCGL